MPVQFSKAAVIAKNNTGIAACELSITRLEAIVGLPASKELLRVAQLSRARNERTQLKSVNTHYRASGTTVKPMAEETAKELNDLGNKLDKQIADDEIINATIGFITSVLTDVGRLRDIADAHRG